jgi:hypothetical protein
VHADRHRSTPSADENAVAYNRYVIGYELCIQTRNTWPFGDFARRNLATDLQAAIGLGVRAMRVKLIIALALLFFASVASADSVFAVTDPDGAVSLIGDGGYTDYFTLSFDWDATNNTFYNIDLSITDSSGAPIPFTVSSVLYADVVPPSTTVLYGTINGGLDRPDVLVQEK